MDDWILHTNAYFRGVVLEVHVRACHPPLAIRIAPFKFLLYVHDYLIAARSFYVDRAFVVFDHQRACRSEGECPDEMFFLRLCSRSLREGGSSQQEQRAERAETAEGEPGFHR